MIFKTCGLKISKDIFEYVVVEWENDYPKVISKGIVYKSNKLDLFKTFKKIIEFFNIDFTAVDVGAYNSKNNIKVLRDLKNIAVVKGVCQVVTNENLHLNLKSIRRKIETEIVPYYLVSFKIAKHKLVNYNRVDIPIDDVMSICFMAKEIKETI